MIAVSREDLPKGFMYYATGHIHKQFFDKNYNIVFPGELFPTSFDELEDYNGGFVIVEETSNGIDVKWKTIKLFDVVLMKFTVTGKTPKIVEKESLDKISNANVSGKVLLLKFDGMLDGKISDIDYKLIMTSAENLGAKIVKKSISGIKTKEFEKIDMKPFSSTDQIEKDLIKDRKDRLFLQNAGDIESLVHSMMKALEEEKIEDETNATFEERLKLNAKKVLGL